MNRDQLEKLARDERFIPGIYNYCDRWCDRCPQTSRCLNFFLSEKEFSDPETRDIRNEAFWNKLSNLLQEALELIKEGAKKWGIEWETLEPAIDDTEMERMKEEDRVAENHLLCRAAKRYAQRVEDWFRGRESLFFESAAAAREGVDLEEAIEVIRWYQYFISAKLIRALLGKLNDEEEEVLSGFPKDSDGSAKIALIAIGRSIGAWAVIHQYVTEGVEGVIDLISLLDGLRQAVEKSFPCARSFVRPGFDDARSNP